MLVAGNSNNMSFERLAPHYSWMETVLAGRRLQRCRIAWLNQLAGCDRILIAGVGHGHFLRAAAQRFPDSEIVSVDASAGMLARAKSGMSHSSSRVQFIHAALPLWRPRSQSFDAIVTHFFLDCFPPGELDSVIAVLADGAKSRARWLVTDFAVPERGWRRYRAWTIHAAMYAFFRPISGVRARRVTPPDDHLRSHGFELKGRVRREWGLLQSDLWSRE
jgi:ubiquinone/menaquinone biosynthesis C-methylase UbiE